MCEHKVLRSLRGPGYGHGYDDHNDQGDRCRIMAYVTTYESLCPVGSRLPMTIHVTELMKLAKPPAEQASFTSVAG